MRSDPHVYRLTFLLPQTLARLSAPGEHRPASGCATFIPRNGLVAIEGDSRDEVFAQAARLLRVLLRRAERDRIAVPPASIPAVLETPGKVVVRDGWSIIVGADVAFSPTRLGAQFAMLELAADPLVSLSS